MTLVKSSPRKCFITKLKYVEQVQIWRRRHIMKWLCGVRSFGLILLELSQNSKVIKYWTSFAFDCCISDTSFFGLVFEQRSSDFDRLILDFSFNYIEKGLYKNVFSHGWTKSGRFKRRKSFKLIIIFQSKSLQINGKFRYEPSLWFDTDRALNQLHIFSLRWFHTNRSK